jgi:hypothetical protein
MDPHYFILLCAVKTASATGGVDHFIGTEFPFSRAPSRFEIDEMTGSSTGGSLTVPYGLQGPFPRGYS